MPSRARAGSSAVARLTAELRANGITDARVLEVMAHVPRPQFVDGSWQTEAWKNKPLPIGSAQTISQPFVVALMTQLLLAGGPRRQVLEIGTGSGYQTAVLAELVECVFSVERIRSLSESARRRLRALGYRNIHCGYADGTDGWSVHGAYDGIIVTAAAAAVSPSLLAQLVPGGRLVVPVGGGEIQQLRVIDRGPTGFTSRDVAAVNFVPLLGGRA
ncbi:MAG: protein-L-isoaspartate(D-aspartate) O-methyltransferase [Nevskiaceae bacterium]|nr:MAG: protein-L-isoaspartate(D-aspartate) O-methyltransferase [Nevskiaceae bacterium]TBR74881.1 MAG: protein-L-isoaspartate(D-aspartate) O-methyltransferase [Nevskiaceae bacterium]